MEMQIQRGLVKYKDRSDIICTYGIAEDGTQYYFMEETKLPNGNIIVTTSLVEAVDSVAASSHVGVVDGEGNIVIPCENKSIKPITDDLLLVERATPQTESVLECIKLRDDPNAATKLVTTPATIKEKMNTVMNNEGRFVFNDQFSEASIFDLNGNNVVNNEYFSFISMTDDKIYFSKNTIDSVINEYSMLPINAETPAEGEQSEINVEDSSISTDQINEAINQEFDNANAGDENVVSPDDVANTVGDNETAGDSEIVIPAGTPEENVEQVEGAPVEEGGEVVIPEGVSTEEAPVEGDPNAPLEFNFEMPEDVAADNVEGDMPTEESDNSADGGFEDYPQDYEEEAPAEELSDDNGLYDMYSDNTPVEDNTTDNSYDYGYDTNMGMDNFDTLETDDNMMDDVTDTISNLVELNKSQQSIIDSYEQKLNKCLASHKKLVELSKSQTREISSLNAKIASLEAENQMLEGKIASLSPTGNNDLARAMADAQNLIQGRRRTRSNY